LVVVVVVCLFASWILVIRMSEPCIDDVPLEDVKKAWDSASWISRYKEHEKEAVDAGRPLWRDPNLSLDRLLVAATTKYLCDGNSLISVDKDGSSVVIDAPGFADCDVKYFSKEYAPLNGVKRAFPATMVRIVNADTVEFHHALMKRYTEAGLDRKVISLNMANQFNPGGGFVRGRIAQEEMLCFRTGLYSCLDKKQYEGPNGFGDFTASLQLNVPVLRKGMEDGFALLKPEERWPMNIVTIAGYDRHKLPKEVQRAPLSPEQYAGTFTKINAILCAAAHAGAHAVVLGALGCGAFANPPDQIAEIFSHVIRRFAGVFEYIYFSILASPTDFKLASFQKYLVGKPVDDPVTYFAPGLSAEDDESKGTLYQVPEKVIDLPSGPILPPCPQMCECEDQSAEHRAAFEHHPYTPSHAAAPPVSA